MTDEKKPDPIWGYSKDDSRIFADGKLPSGYYANPAMVPGSEAEKRYKEDAEREGAHIPWETSSAPQPPDPPAPKPTLTLPEAKK